MEIRAIVEKVEKSGRNPFFIFISGESCAGKTFLAKKLLAYFKDEAALIEMDDYFKDRDDPSLPMFGGRLSFDLPTSYWLEEIKTDVTDLKHYIQIGMPTYDILKNVRTGKRLFDRKRVIIVEGLYASMVSDAIINPEEKINIMVKAATKTRLTRRIQRDVARFSWSEEDIESYFYSHIEPIGKMYISRQKADLIIEND